MPLTTFQETVLITAALGQDGESYLAGGAALHIHPQSARYSNDLDFFHDSEQRVAQTFATARQQRETAGFSVVVELSQPGHIHALVRRGHEATRVDWAHDTAWRFMPLQRSPHGAWLLHPVDLAINKVLALAGRDEPRDFVDILFVHRTILPLGAVVWAAAGKDPGFSPSSLLELLKRRGRYRPEAFDRLHLAQPFDLPSAKTEWLSALESAAQFIAERSPQEVGCLYWSNASQRFVAPSGTVLPPDVTPHFGQPGGVIPLAQE